MRFLPVTIHGILDYLVALFTILSPWLLDFRQGRAETAVPVIVGLFTILYSLLTCYRYGVMPVLGMGTHLWLDFFGGLFLLTSPWIYGFADHVFIPHVLIGGFEILASVISRKTGAGVRICTGSSG